MRPWCRDRVVGQGMVRGEFCHGRGVGDGGTLPGSPPASPGSLGKAATEPRIEPRHLASLPMPSPGARASCQRGTRCSVGGENIKPFSKTPSFAGSGRCGAASDPRTRPRLGCAGKIPPLSLQSWLLVRDRKPLPFCLGKFSISLVSSPNLLLNRSNFPGPLAGPGRGACSRCRPADRGTSCSLLEEKCCKNTK